MKRFLDQLAVFAAVLLSVTACSKEGPAVRIEYDAEWAAAYYLGTDGQGELGNYQLAMAQGRTDEDLALLSSGAVISLQMAAPATRSIRLPDGKYLGSDGGQSAFTFIHGETLAEGTVSGSYVGIRHGTSSPMQYYPIGEGEASIAFSQDGNYQITIHVKAEKHTFVFNYTGPIETFDFTGPEL